LKRRDNVEKEKSQKHIAKDKVRKMFGLKLKFDVNMFFNCVIWVN